MKKNGFTIVELMVVMLVIAILLSITIARFKGVQDQANISKAQAELKTAAAALESYYANQDPKAYPATSDTVVEDVLVDAIPNIIDEVLYDPFLPAGTQYDYILSNDESYYVIFSVGPDGVADITGLNDGDGELTGVNNDDIFETNGTGW